ncbi:hypothetical protein [Streptomyces sp. CB03911]|uniref:hypothetical protein n=1 Tax=Streptomyces sp. CB03911 TaxID=1804758 RepID=UPI00093F5A96|nr:hypothetical protein [Streptomyces sp. CB03911]OKI19281.1 hypothetical protein A6A07_07205 [Streptomyces sp. CB03911]
MITAIIDHPDGSWPKFPRVVTAKDDADLDRKVERSIRGFKAYFGAQRAALTTVVRVVGTVDVSARYVKEES